MKPLSELRIMGVRGFRAEFSTLTEPVVVISRNQIKGVWMPGTGAIAPEVASQVGGLLEHLTTPTPFGAHASGLRPVPRRPTRPDDRFNTRPFTPVPKK